MPLSPIEGLNLSQMTPPSCPAPLQMSPTEGLHLTLVPGPIFKFVKQADGFVDGWWEVSIDPTGKWNFGYVSAGGGGEGEELAASRKLQ